jgi:hypothetical protein
MQTMAGQRLMLVVCARAHYFCCIHPFALGRPEPTLDTQSPEDALVIHSVLSEPIVEIQRSYMYELFKHAGKYPQFRGVTFAASFWDTLVLLFRRRQNAGVRLFATDTEQPSALFIEANLLQHAFQQSIPALVIVKPVATFDWAAAVPEHMAAPRAIDSASIMPRRRRRYSRWTTRANETRRRLISALMTPR